MKRSQTSVVSALFVVVLAGLLTRFWFLYPGLFPGLLKDLGNRGVDALGIASAEAVADLEMAFVFVVSWLLMRILAGAAGLLWRQWGRSAARDASGPAQ